MGESGQVVLAGSGTKSLLFQPKGLQLNALFGCVGARGLRFGAEDEVCWIGLGERLRMGSNTSVMAATRPGAKSGQGDFLSPFPLLSPVASPCHSTTPALHFSTIPCNLCRRFPLYGVEAGGLPAKATRRKEAKMDKNYNYRLLILTVTTGHAAHAMTRPIGN